MARARALPWLFAALVLAPAGGARADAPEPAAPSIARDGRGLVFGASAAFLLGATPLTNVDVEDEPSLAPGWRVDGRFGYELPSGIAISILGGGGAMASVHRAPPLFLRAQLELRVTIDLGDFRPFASIAAGFMLLKAGPNLRATFTGDASVGFEIALASWAALEASVGVEVLAPGDALRDVMVFVLLPRLGAGFRY